MLATDEAQRLLESGLQSGKLDADEVALGLDASEHDPFGVLKVTRDGFSQAAHAIAQLALSALLKAAIFMGVLAFGLALVAVFPLSGVLVRNPEHFVALRHEQRTENRSHAAATRAPSARRASAWSPVPQHRSRAGSGPEPPVAGRRARAARRRAFPSPWCMSAGRSRVEGGRGRRRAPPDVANRSGGR